ncbi:extracellular solute-binding protein [Actinobacillus delphinicola]|uniref:Extracellular solute-binding protein n=2 Tax=Actinobacillus delphinicola TaxID=51161 RepID=A0A448TTX6_9PAST|nr:extracellular solute-binding protein [Actinobacillus delphinicola]
MRNSFLPFLMSKRLSLRGLLLIALGISSLSLQAAPRIPAEVLNNGLVYCASNTGLSFNPQSAEDGTSMNIVTAQIYNRLFAIKKNSDKVMPELATGYSMSADGKTLLIYLRHHVKFQQTPWFTPTRNFNADDVVFSLNRMLGRTLDSAHPTSKILRKLGYYPGLQINIYHQQAKKIRFPYFQSIKLNEKIQSIDAIGKYTVRIRLYTPDYSILSHLASQYAIIFSQEYATQLDADDNLSNLDIFPVGTGPYQLNSFFRNQYVRLVRNKHYWGKKAKIKNVVIDLSNNQSGRMLKFLNNECQIAATPELSQLEILEQSRGRNYYLHEAESMNLAYLAFNFHKDLMQDERIRRAISQAINRKRIVNALYYGNASVANHLIPNTSWAFQPDVHPFDYGYDPVQARKILAPLHLTLNLWVINEEHVYNPSPISMAEIIQYDLNKAGVNVKIRYITRPFLNQHLEDDTADYDLILTGWLSNNLDPDNFMHPILSCSTQNDVTNLSHWCNADFEYKLKQALLSNKTAQRATFYNQAQDIVLNKLPIIPIANVKRILVVKDRVRGLNSMSYGNIQFSALALKTEAK